MPQIEREPWPPNFHRAEPTGSKYLTGLCVSTVPVLKSDQDAISMQPPENGRMFVTSKGDMNLLPWRLPR